MMLSSSATADPEAASRRQTEIAGFASRAMAHLIDISLLTFLGGLLFFLAGHRLFQEMPTDFQGLFGASLAFLVIFFAVPPLLFLVYFTLCHAGGGQTVGKMFMGVRVVSASGGEVGLGQAFLRSAAMFLSALPLGAGFLWAVIDIQHRTWHDILAATKVVFVANYP
jgi:uncharacterized RDD family membrane protein YckC